MKVCVVSLNLAAYFDPNPRTRYGGAEVQAAFVARALKEQGADVRVVVADLPAEARIPYPAESAFRTADGIPVLRFFHPRMTGISDALARADADVYYQHCAGMVTGLTAHFARAHGRVFAYGAGSDSDFSFRRVLIEGLRDRVLFQYGLRRAHGVVVQNTSQRAAADASLSSPRVLIPSGVLPVERLAVNANGPVLWAGGLRRVKRPDLAIELARRLPSREFVIVGGGTTTETDYAAAIERQAGAVSNIRMTGWLPHSGVMKELARASVVINTSELEGFPNVYVEAWNHGVPVVSFNDVDGLLAHEKLGALCTDLDDMERVLRALLDDPQALAAAGERARRIVTERFSPSVLGPKYVSFFESLLAGRGVGQGVGVLATR